MSNGLHIYTFSAQLNVVSSKCGLSVNTSALQQKKRGVLYCVSVGYYNYSQATIFSSHTSYLSGRVQEA